MERIIRPSRGITIALLFTLICGLARPASAKIVYVNQNATGTVHDGKSWTTAFTAVQPAIDAARSGDEVWVAAATYIERISVKSSAPLYGGFAGTESSRSQRDWRHNTSVLSSTGMMGYPYVLVTLASAGAVVDGFTVTAPGYSGLYVGSGSASISNCTFTGDSEPGLQVDGGTASIANCAFSGNDQGVSVTSGSAEVRCCTFNKSTNGVYAANSGSVSVSNCTISQSSIGVNVYNFGNATVTNCTISGNTIGAYAGYGAMNLTNCIVAFNGAGVSGYSTEATVRLSHNDVYGNKLANYKNVADPTGTNGNISQDPRLSNSYHDIRTQPSSPCADAGDDSVVQTGWTDVDGQPRIIGTHVDIGSDESDGTLWTVPSHVWFVSPTGNDANDGSSWSMAKKTVANGVRGAQGTDEVWVASGTYAGWVWIPAGVAVYGGFTGNETARNQRDWKNAPTILEGSGGSGTVVSAQYEGAVVDGFTIRNNYVGVYANTGIALSVANCTISGTTSSGVYVNTGGIAWATNCTISGNAKYGVYSYNTGVAVVTNCVISGNLEGVYTELWGTAKVTNTTIVGNSMFGVYGGYGNATITNCNVAFNGTGISKDPGGAGAPLSYNDVYGNTVGNYGSVPDPTGTNGNISADPRFVDRAHGDYHLLPGSPCIDAGDNSAVTPGEADLDGLARIRFGRVDIGAYEYATVLTPWSVSLGAPVAGGVTVSDRIAYVAGNDGRLYARSTDDGSVAAGFPVDISAAVGATVRLPSRPAVYYGKTGKAIYLTTDRGDVVRVLPTGTVAWHVRPLTGQTVSTPAVTPDGNVYVDLSTGSAPFNNYVFKLDEATGTPLSLSPFLGYTTADNIGDFSPAANSRYLYVNAGWGSKSGLTLLNQDNLAVRSSFAGGEQCLSPLLLGSDLLLASKSGKAWKMNAVTLAPDLGFGHFGVADLGTQITAAPFSDAAGNVYIGTANGRILKWTPGTGAFTPFYTATGKVSGLTINRTGGILGFGTSTGSFVQVPLSNPAAATVVTPGGPISAGPVFESLTDRFIVVTDSGVLSGFPSVR